MTSVAVGDGVVGNGTYFLGGSVVCSAKLGLVDPRGESRAYADSLDIVVDRQELKDKSLLPFP